MPRGSGFIPGFEEPASALPPTSGSLRSSNSPSHTRARIPPTPPTPHTNYTQPKSCRRSYLLSRCYTVEAPFFFVFLVFWYRGNGRRNVYAPHTPVDPPASPLSTLFHDSSLSFQYSMWLRATSPRSISSAAYIGIIVKVWVSTVVMPSMASTALRNSASGGCPAASQSPYFSPSRAVMSL